MITYDKLDLRTVTAGIVVHGVNCQGKMGSGVALAIRQKWPSVYKAYKTYWEKNQNNRAGMLGFVLYVDTGAGLNLTGLQLYIANIFTQLYYGNDGAKYANPEAIEQGLSTVASLANQRSLPIYMPKIGCGLGGLDWETEVRPIVEKISAAFPNVAIHVCEL
jgi:O-acetyl-ADP-ribose deacetylase (regulator of RNase III)